MKRTLLIAVTVMALVAGIAAYAYGVDTGTITVNAVVNPRITLTMADTTADLEVLDVATGNLTDSETLNLNVRSNVPYAISLNDLGGDDLSVLGFTMTNIAGTYLKAPGATGANHPVTFAVDVTGVDWPDATTLTHAYTYSVVAN